MVDECKIILEKDVYYPGQVVNGTVECALTSNESNIRAIRIRFNGRAKAYWREGRYGIYTAEETYFNTEVNLLGDSIITQGQHKYPFSFNLPYLLPPSVNEEYGNVKYVVKVTIDRAWAFNYQVKKPLTVISHTDLNTLDAAKKSIEVIKTKKPFSLLSETGIITVNIKLPITGYVPSQMVLFSAHVTNDSHVNIREVCFKLVQRFEFRTELKRKSIDTGIGQKFVITDSGIAPGCEKSWDLLELRVPKNVCIGDLFFCNVIKSFFELRGEVKLPLPHKNFKITIPLILGNVPLENRNIS